MQGVIKYLYEKSASMKILTKLSAVYVLAILIPALIMGSYSYIKNTEHAKKEVIINTHRTLTQIIDNINYKILIMQSICDNIANNSNIIQFLDEEYKYEYSDIVTYRSIYGVVAGQALYFKQGSINNVSLFFNNASIPETWDGFYSEERILNMDWYKSFMSDDKNSRWFLTDNLDFFNTGKVRQERAYSYVKKIFLCDNIGYVGSIRVEMLQREMFSALKNMTNENDMMFVIDGNKNVTYSSRPMDTKAETQVMEKFANQDDKEFIYNNILYSFQQIEPLNITVVYKISLKDSLKASQVNSRNTILVILAGVLVLEMATFYIIKIIISRFNQIVRLMNKVSQGYFNVRIPIAGKDEIGQIAEDFNLLIEKINTLIKDLLSKEVAQKDAQITALQYQIDPHYIYNTIDIFRMRIELAGNYETAELLTEFGKTLRYCISTGKKFSTIEEEIKFVYYSINLLKLRYEDKIDFFVNVPEELSKINMLKFILQPIVENCVKHGFTNDKERIKINITVKSMGEDIIFIIYDTGGGIRKDKLECLNKQFEDSIKMTGTDESEGNIGLFNINERLKLFYGSDYFIRMESNFGEYTRVIFNIKKYTTDFN
jgi:two-component system sensor histidine kinase YesM